MSGTDAIDVPRLRRRAAHYARKAGADAGTIAQLDHMLGPDPVGSAVLELSDEKLHSMLITDLYKVKVSTGR